MYRIDPISDRGVEQQSSALYRLYKKMTIAHKDVELQTIKEVAPSGHVLSS